MKTIPQLPLLESLCWNIANPYDLSDREKLSIYEERWQYKGLLGEPDGSEIIFIQSLIDRYRGLPLVNIASASMNKSAIRNLIDIIFSSLDLKLLDECEVYLSGGALVNLYYNMAMLSQGSQDEGASLVQFRYSQDLDFLCKNEGFYLLRQRIARNASLLFTDSNSVSFDSPRIDRYAIRLPVRVNDTNFKLEFVVEETLDLDPVNRITRFNIPCLNRIDLIAAKLLANYDRGLDRSKFFRDLIDLCILRLQGEFPALAIEKANAAYRLNQSIETSLFETIELFQKDPHYRAKCYQQLQIDNPRQAIDGLDLLAEDLDSPKTQRTFQETDFSYLE
ncbi:MAG TPA: nucleotidyl transferase AbiEii/AbiGii toxin family protein [Xenococcaceae cyanobacterium]|jgi:hypothetical protein